MFRKLLFLVLLSIIISACNNPVEQDPVNDSKLQIAFQNNSQFELENFTVSEKLIGNIKPGSSTKYFAFETIGFDSGLPDEDASANTNGIKVTNHYRNYWCGTEKFTADSGKYLIEIEVRDTVLFLYCKNAPRI